MSVNATNVEASNNFISNRTVNFVENGISFTLFTNGYFNYETNIFINRNGRRSRQQILIGRDVFGSIIFINNIPIRYNRRNRVSRIGNLSIRYDKGNIINVGHLNISYNRWGEPIFLGNVRRNNADLTRYSRQICSDNNPFFYRNDFRRNYAEFRRDRNFIYYKNNSNIILRRRLTNTFKRQNNGFKNRSNSNNSVRKNTNITKNNTSIIGGNRNAIVIKNRTVVKRSNDENRNNKKRKPDARRRS